MSYLLSNGLALPPKLIGTSGGAAVAASLLTTGVEHALETCIAAYASNARNLDIENLKRLKLTFAHRHIYPAWISSFVNADTFEMLQKSRAKLVVAVTRPGKLLGLTGSVLAATAAYLLDKYLWNSIHPQLPKKMGLRQDFVTLNECAALEDAQILLTASATAPPFMKARTVAGSLALDGGYTDNAPIGAQTDADRQNTFVLLTRYYPRLPQLFELNGATYWQPSQKIPVSTWDCTARTEVRRAFEMGVTDARDAVSSGKLLID
jgi:predicted patatin/cPLA2 family phospholipase